MILTRANAGSTNLINTRGAKAAEIEVAGTPGFVVTGTKTIQIEVRE